MFQEILSTRLRNLRLAKDLSQAALGNLVGISKQAVNDIENGRNSTTLERACALADALHVSLDYLVGRSGEPSMNGYYCEYGYWHSNTPNAETIASFEETDEIIQQIESGDRSGCMSLSELLADLNSDDEADDV